MVRKIVQLRLTKLAKSHANTCIPLQPMSLRGRFRKFWQTDWGNSGRCRVTGQSLLELKVPRPVGRSVEVEEPSSLEDLVQDGGVKSSSCNTRSPVVR